MRPSMLLLVSSRMAIWIVGASAGVSGTTGLATGSTYAPGAFLEPLAMGHATAASRHAVLARSTVSIARIGGGRRRGTGSVGSSMPATYARAHAAAVTGG